MTTVICVAVWGCGSSGSWLGAYKGQLQPERPFTDAIDGSNRRVELEVKRDNQFVMTLQGMPVTGEIRISGSHGDLVATQILGQPIERQEMQLRDSLSNIVCDRVDDSRLLLCWGKMPKTCVQVTRSLKPGGG